MNPWIEHVKRFQAQHGCSYKDALQHAKHTYMVGKGNVFRRPKQTTAEIRPTAQVAQYDPTDNDIPGAIVRPIPIMTSEFIPLTRIQERKFKALIRKAVENEMSHNDVIHEIKKISKNALQTQTMYDDFLTFDNPENKITRQEQKNRKDFAPRISRAEQIYKARLEPYLLEYPSELAHTEREEQIRERNMIDAINAEHRLGRRSVGLGLKRKKRRH